MHAATRKAPVDLIGFRRIQRRKLILGAVVDRCLRPVMVPVAATWDQLESFAELPSMAFIGPPPTPRDVGDQTQK